MQGRFHRMSAQPGDRGEAAAIADGKRRGRTCDRGRIARAVASGAVE
jgi:hypothetical protein